MEDYFYEAFENMDRLGPGDNQSTLKAIECIDKNQTVKILDIGCGVGSHTFLMAKSLENAEVVAIDNSSDFIDQFNHKAKQYNLDNRVKGICMSMFEMTFEDSSFDYIFAEGSIYIAGFETGLKEWKRFLKPNGKLICSEISWITDNQSKQAKAYWEANYPQIDSIENKNIQAENLGYEVVNHFILPKEAWTDNYYVPLQRNIDAMKAKYPENAIALEVARMIQEEIDLYTNHGTEYSYVFYVLQAK